MMKKKSTGIIKLEERVLFEAAAAPEIAALAAMNEAAAEADNDAEADVQDGNGEKGDAPAGENAVDAIDQSALEAALAAGPDGANIADESVVRENGETADGLDAEEDASDDIALDPVNGIAFDAPEATAAEGLLAVAESDGSVELDLSDPASIVIDSSVDTVISVAETSADPVMAIAEEINSNSEADKHELLIINSNTSGIDTIIEEAGEGKDILILDTDSTDPMADIVEFMAEKDYDYDAVHFVSHGDSKGIMVGTRHVTEGEYFAPMGEYLSEDADIMVYGCDTASTEEGQAFLQEMADATGADIAASIDGTGSSEYGANWDLEYTIGEVEADSVAVSNQWNNELAAITIGTGGTYKDLNDFWTKNPLRQKGVLLEGDVITLKSHVTESYAGPIYVLDDNLAGGEVIFVSDVGGTYTYTFNATIEDNQMFVGSTSGGDHVVLQLGSTAGDQDVALEGNVALGDNDYIYMNNSAIEGTLGLGEGALLSTHTTNMVSSVWDLNITTTDTATIDGGIYLNVRDNLYDTTSGGTLVVTGESHVTVGGNVSFSTGTIHLNNNTVFSGTGSVETLELGNSGTPEIITIQSGVLSVTNNVLLEDGDQLNLSNGGGIDGTLDFRGRINVTGTGSVTTLRTSSTGTTEIDGGTLNVDYLLDDGGSVTLNVGTGATLNVTNAFDYSNDTIVLANGGKFSGEGTVDTLDITLRGGLIGRELTVNNDINVTGTEVLDLYDDAVLHAAVNLEGTVAGTSGTVDTLNVIGTGAVIRNSDLTVNTLEDNAASVVLTVNNGGMLSVVNDFDYTDDEIILNNGTLSANGTLKTLTLGAYGGTLEGGNLTVTDAVNVIAGSTLSIRGITNLTATGGVNNAGTLAGSGQGALLNLTGNLTNNTAGTVAASLGLNVTGNVTNSGTINGTLLSVTGNVTNNAGTIAAINAVTGNVTNSATINSLGGVTGTITNNAGATIGQLYSVQNVANVTNNGTINMLLLSVTGENGAAGLEFTTVNEAFNFLQGGTVSFAGSGTVNNTGLAIVLNPYTYAESNAFRTANDVVTDEEALTLTVSRLGRNTVTLNQALTITTQPGAPSTVEGYNMNYTATYADIIIGNGVTLNFNDSGSANDYTFKNAGITVADGGTLNINADAELTFSGNGVTANYKFLSANAYTMNNGVTYQGAGITNAGTVNIDGAEVTFNRETLNGFSSIQKYNTYGIKNDGANASVSITDSDVEFNLGTATSPVSRAADAYALWNAQGSVYIENSDITLNSSRSSVDDNIKSIVIYNESRKDVNAVSSTVMQGLSESDALANANVVVDNGRISINGGNEETYAVMNNGSMYFENSFVLAEGRKDVYGVKNDTNGLLEFHVTGDAYENYDTLDAFFNTLGVNWGDYQNDQEKLISDFVIPGIGGKNIGNSGNVNNVYSVTNAGQAYLHYTGDITADNTSWVGSTTGNTYTDVPLMLLYGTYQTVGTAQEGQNIVLSDLDQVTIANNGNDAKSLFISTGTATNLLNDVSVKDVVNDGSQFHITGTFEQSIFSVYSSTTNLLNWAGNENSTVTNLNTVSALGSQKDGEMFFGRAATDDSANMFHSMNGADTWVDGEYDNRVEFSADVSYDFTNNARMTIENYQGLGVKEEHSVSIENADNRHNTYNGGSISAILTIENAITTQKEVNGTLVDVVDVNGNPITLADDYGNVTMYVENRGDTPVNADPDVDDYGIVNYSGKLTMNGVNVLNTGYINGTRSHEATVAVTNQGGIFSMNGGALIGTYSGFDNIEVVNKDPSNSSIDIEIRQGEATLQNITAVAGTAFGIRNSGMLEFTNQDTALVTNDLNVTVEAGSSLDKLFRPFDDSAKPVVDEAIAIANYTVAAAVQVIHTAAAGEGRPATARYTIKISSYQDDVYIAASGWLTPAQIPASWDVTLTAGTTKLGSQTFAPSTHTVAGSNPLITHAVYGTAYTDSTISVDNVEIKLSHVELYPTIAVLNEATATVTGITSFENYMDSINNVGNTYKSGNWPNWCISCVPENTATFVNKVGGENVDRVSDAYISFSCNINASGVENKDILTLEGLNVTDDQGNILSSGSMTVSGAPYRVKAGNTETFLNLTITSPENETYAIINNGTLVIENTYTLQQDIVDERGNVIYAAGNYSIDEAEAVMEAGKKYGGGQLVDTNAAYISALKGTAIQNNSNLTMINATVKDSVNGIENDGTMYMVNSQVVDNSSWGFINVSGNADILNSTIAFNKNGMDVQGGTVNLVNTILVNDGLSSDVNRTQHQLTADEMGINYQVSGGKLNDVAGNIIGENWQNWETTQEKLDHARANSELLADIYSFNGTSDQGTATYFDDSTNSFTLANNSPALTNGVLVSVDRNDSGSITGYDYGTNRDSLSGTFIIADKDGNSREPGDKGNIVIGATVPASPVPLPPTPTPGPGPDPSDPTIEQGSNIVTTDQDIIDYHDGLISLREAISYAMTYGDGNVYFNANALGYGDVTITLDASLGSILLNDGSVTINGVDHIYNNSKTNITIDGSMVSGSTVVVGPTGDAEFKDISVTAGSGTYVDSSLGVMGGTFLVVGGALTISGTGTYTGNSTLDSTGKPVVDRGSVIASVNGNVNVSGDVTFRNGLAAEYGGFLFQTGENAVANIGNTNSNIVIEGMDATNGAVVAQVQGKVNLINVVVRNNGAYDGTAKEATANELFATTDELTLVNASVYNNFADAVFGLYQAVDSEGNTAGGFDGKIFVVNSSIVNNAVGYQMNENGKYVYDNSGNRQMDYSTAFFWSEDVSSTQTSTSQGQVYILNSLVSTEVDTANENVTVQVANSATGEYGKASFMYNMDGSLMLDADTYVPVTNPGNGAAESGVITAVYTDLDGNRAIALKQTLNGQWMDMDGNVLSQYYQDNMKYDAIGEISVSGNGSHRYVGQSNIYIGAYSRAYAETAVQNNIVVTTTADEMDGNADISLREAVKYAEKLHEQTGFTYTIVFADGLEKAGDVTLDHTLYINESLNIAGGGDITLSASGILDEAMIVVNGTNVNVNDVTVDGLNNYNTLTGGRGIFEVTAGGQAAVNDVDMINGLANFGGAVYNAGTLSINDGQFSNNTASEGGVIYNEGSLAVSGSSFANNSAIAGAAIFNTGNLTVAGSSFSGNTAGDGIIYSTENVNISGSSFGGNHAAGTIVYGAENVNISGSSFTGNRTGFDSIVFAEGNLSVSGSKFTGNNSGYGVVDALGSMNIVNSEFRGNTAAEFIAVSDGSMNISGSSFTNNLLTEDLSAVALSLGNLTVSGSTVSGNSTGEFGGVLDAVGNLNVSNSSIVNNASGLTVLYSQNKDVTVTGSTISGNTPSAAVMSGDNVTIGNSTITDNSAANGIIFAESALKITNSTVSGNTAAQIIDSDGNITLDEVSMSNNKGNGLLEADGYVTVISSTLADTEGNGTVKVDAGKDAYILNSTVASASANAGILVSGKDVYIVNSILVSNDANNDVATGNLYAAYSIVSGDLQYEYSDEVQGNWSYTDAFGDTKVNSSGMLVPVSSITSQRGVFINYSVNADGSLNIAYSDPYDDQMITDGYYFDPLRHLSWTTITESAPVNGTVIRYSHQQYITMPGIGAYWSGSYTVDYGPGLNNAFVDSSFDGTLDYYDWSSEYDAVVAALPSGVAEDVAVSVSSIDGFSGNIYEGMNSGFRITERFDVGGMVSGETYISETVGADGEDLGGEFFVTPTTAEGVPVMLDAESIDEVGDIALEDTLAELAGSMENIAEKASSLFRRAEIFKDNFDKAIEELLDIKA